ncbi:G-type lectin S-receptor-like serine/threonine-protein kinase LECRK4 [Lycium ferocissimum]|uniref:G-type lectin S-receptor-like serine/threonine-protein kinase LECRK4 n=1 Tax=Lycium ferocissimum TaxID=112874 RepID=UPI002814E2D4|nr:G-type lectin S-receptor-like serine/threonine-protein kinase LECRK4 [Lycium ferocissimum]
MISKEWHQNPGSCLLSSYSTCNGQTYGYILFYTYRFTLAQEGLLLHSILNTIALPKRNAYEAYFCSNTVDTKSPNMARNRRIVNLTSGAIVPPRDYYYRAILEYDSVFAQYAHSKAPRNGKNQMISAQPFRVNLIWELVVPIAIACLTQMGGLIDLYDMYTLDNIFWPNSSNYEELQFFNQDECRNSCLFDSNCVVAVEKSGTCYKKKLPVSNGRREQVNSKAFVKLLISSIPTGDFPYSTSDRGHRKKDKRPKFVGSSSIPETNLRNFTFRELKVATDSFKLELGRGAFGTIYRGEFSSSNLRTIIAVKKLDRLANDGEKEFKTEASVIARTHHKNFVRLAFSL